MGKFMVHDCGGDENVIGDESRRSEYETELIRKSSKQKVLKKALK